MRPLKVENFRAGSYRKRDGYRYFLPVSVNRRLLWSDAEIDEMLEKAALKLGELTAFSRLATDADVFTGMQAAKEAVISSRIEGTRTNLEESFTAERALPPQQRDDWEEVNNYGRAMNAAIENLDKLPLSNRLLRNAHKILLSSGRGKHKLPGAFRRSQNWIGGATISEAVFVPPAHTELPALLADFEKFLHNDAIAPHLIKIAVAHYQFETIHPFLDGNGRIGRLLITLYLVANGIMEKPLLYLSDFFERNKDLYYDNLTRVREKNDLARWIKYFLTGVYETAGKSADTLGRAARFKDAAGREQIFSMGRRAKKAVALFNYLFRKPVISIKDAQTATGLSPRAANELVRAFVARGILTEKTGYQRNRIFLFSEYLDLFRDE